MQLNRHKIKRRNTFGFVLGISLNFTNHLTFACSLIIEDVEPISWYQKLALTKLVNVVRISPCMRFIVYGKRKRKAPNLEAVAIYIKNQLDDCAFMVWISVRSV